MESPGRLGLSRALVACALLVAPSIAAGGRPSWRDAHSKHDTPSSQGSHHPSSSAAPHVVRTEAGVPVSERDPVLWTLIPSPFMEELQMLAAKGDSYATLAPQKWDAWRAWKATFRPGKQYDSVGTEVQAFRAFIENDQVIATHNADHASSYYSLGHSEWSATSFHEFENLMFPVKTQDIMPPVHGSSGVHGYLDAEGKPKQIPTSVDWTEEGAVSPVGNQGECGSCWAFASTGAIEGICAIQGHTANGVGPLALSAQELVSCDVGTLEAPYADDGCDGGLPQNAFGYAKTTGGLCTAEEYSYVSGNGHSYPCTHCTKRLSVGGYKTVESGNELALMHAVAQQPVAVAIQANSMQLQLYRSGVFDSPSCGKEPDHAVLLVGYGTTSTNVPYWKVKNSWGTTWGDGGYFYLKRGVNQCGITTMPSYPINCSPINGGDPRGKPVEPLPDPDDCPAPRDGDIKLTSYPAGNLLIHFEGAYHPLCSQHLEIETAELMCKALGYSTAWSFSDRTIPAQNTGPMFPSLHCDKGAKDLPQSQLGGANVLDMCSFKSAHTSDWLCELFGPSMAAYLVCFGTTPPQAVQTCGTAAWPNRKPGSPSEAAQMATALMRERLAASATRPAARSAFALFAAAATAGVGLLAIAAVTISRAYRQQRKNDDLL